MELSAVCVHDQHNYSNTSNNNDNNDNRDDTIIHKMYENFESEK
jgi:hypothetical protein